jgi:hypothetical protein
MTPDGRSPTGEQEGPTLAPPHHQISLPHDILGVVCLRGVGKKSLKVSLHAATSLGKSPHAWPACGGSTSPNTGTPARGARGAPRPNRPWEASMLRSVVWR